MFYIRYSVEQRLWNITPVHSVGRQRRHPNPPNTPAEPRPEQSNPRTKKSGRFSAKSGRILKNKCLLVFSYRFEVPVAAAEING